MLIDIVAMVSFRPKPIGIEVNSQFANLTYIIYIT